MSSPTFVLMTEYAGRLPMFHVDLYRLDDAADALAGGLLDERQLEGVALVEWAERLGSALPAARLDVVIDGSGDEPRRIALRAGDPSYRALPGGRRVTAGPLLVVDTATTTAVIALGTPDGALLATRSWVAGYRHGEELLAQIEALLAEQGVGRDAIGGLVVGTGPGAFTGLRVGIATVKGLAYALHLPVVGVPTGAALLRAAAASAGEAPLVLVQPAGPSDRVLTRPGEPSRILPGGAEPGLRPGERLVAVDLDGREAPEAVGARRGRARRPRAGAARRRRRTPGGRRRGRPRPPRPRVRDAPARGAGGAPGRRRRRAHRRRGAAMSDAVLLIRPMAIDDLATVQHIERTSFSTPWPPQAYRQELETNRLAHYLVAQLGGEVVGYGGIWIMVDEAHVTTFAVHPALPPPPDRGAAAARAARPVRRPRRPRGDARGPAVEHRRPPRCTRSTASGRSASGRATTATTRRTR